MKAGKNKQQGLVKQQKLDKQQFITRLSNCAVVGLGQTGKSCLRFLNSLEITPVAFDTRDNLDITQFSNYTGVEINLGEFTEEKLRRLSKFSILIVSPGLDLTLLEQYFANLSPDERPWVVGDIELFAQFNTIPAIGITGSNGKSSVATLLYQMAMLSGKKAALIGNIGQPVLDSLQVIKTKDGKFNQVLNYDLFVIELSSFQLELTYSLVLQAATILNISSDHLDRHKSMQNYIQAKQRIFLHATQSITNSVYRVEQDYIVKVFGNNPDIGASQIIPLTKTKLIGRHNYSNICMALSLGDAIGLNLKGMIQAIEGFNGLAHRCQKVAELKEIYWINDSKATNIASSIAAIDSLTEKKNILLILGGQAKGQDFSEMLPYLSAKVKHVLLLGVDANFIYQTIYKQQQNFDIHQCVTLECAVKTAAKLAVAKDIVLLAPACASQDQFLNFAHRGDAFVEYVNELACAVSAA